MVERFDSPAWLDDTEIGAPRRIDQARVVGNHFEIVIVHGQSGGDVDGAE